MIIEIPITQSDNILIKENQSVDFNTPLLKKTQTRKEIINIAKLLDVSYLKIFKYLKKFVGENVKKGDIIAVKKGLITDKKIFSPCEGIITQIDHNTGEIIIETTTDKEEFLNAFFIGKVVSIKDNIIALKIKKGSSFNTKNSSDNFGGLWINLPGLNYFSLKSEDVTNKIVIVEKLDLLMQTKIEALGAKGFVTLHKLPSLPLNINYCQLINLNDFNQIKNLKFPYCLNIKNTGKIYFYE